MAQAKFALRATVSTESPELVEEVLVQQVPGGTVRRTEGRNEFLVDGVLAGPNARELNRTLLSALRRVEKRTRLRAEWTREGITECFFDYVPKAKRTADPPTESA